jgi:predicted ribosome quality control (RQC) complex YloA/Tae2 family protein
MMTYDGFILAAVAAELKKQIERGQIQNIRQHNESDFTFEIRAGGKSYLLFMSVSARFSRIYTASTNQPVPKTAPNFCMLLRKHLKGSFIKSVEQSGFDRVLQIYTEAADGNRNVLVLELMGKHSNLILLSDSGRILGAAKNITAAVSRYRQVLPGRDYMPPPGGAKANPIIVTDEEFNGLWHDGLSVEATPEDVKHWLVAAFSGIGPFLAEELMRRADEPTPEAIRAALRDLQQIIFNQDFAPVLITDDRGAAIYAYPIPVDQYPSANQHGRYSMNEVLDTLYRDIIKRDAFNAEYSGLETSIRRSIAWRDQMLRDLDKALAESEQAERYKQFGELILAGANAIVKGQKVAKVVDYYDPEMSEAEIPLDEKLSPKENAERYFRRYKKAVEGASTAVDRQKEIRTDIKILESAKEKLPTAPAVENLRELRKMLTQQGLLRAEPKPPIPGKKEEPEFGTAKIRRTTSSDGLEILYGENSQSNDYLTTKVARPNDIWFHARSVTGAHVIVKTANRPETVPPGTIRQAAEIAARNSDAKHSSLVAVDYTLKKFVRKPRAAAPGFVIYEKEKTIDVTPSLGS